MNSDIRLSVGFWRHFKTNRLERALGLRGIRSLQILWCWAAQNKPDGVLEDLDCLDIEFVADWRGKKGAFVEACLAIGWLELEGKVYRLHEWSDYNPYQAKGAEREIARKEKAKKAADMRWGKKTQEDSSICSDDAQAYAKTDPSICSDDAQAYAKTNPSICSDDAQAYAKNDSSICSDDAKTCSDPCLDDAWPMPSLTLTSTKDLKDSINPPMPPRGKAELKKPPESPPEKRQAGKLALQALMAEYTQNPALLKALDDYREMRERIRKGLTAQGLKLAFSRLDSLAEDDAGKIAILEQSVFNSWQGLFSLKEDARASPEKQKSEWQINQQSHRNMAKRFLENAAKKEAENEKIYIPPAGTGGNCLPDRAQ